LEGLLTLNNLNIRVVTKPDTPQGRHMRLTPSPVAKAAQGAGLAVDKPARLVDLKEAWSQWQPDLIITAAYGKILRPWLLNLPRYGVYNLHASLLPRWRGPNPIAWAIREGDTVTGVTLMKVDEGVDTGDIVAARRVAITPEMNTGDLTLMLAYEAQKLLKAYFDQLCLENIHLVPQNADETTYAGKFDPADSHIQWNQPAEVINRLIRSMTPEPGAYTICQGQRVKLVQSAYDTGEQPVGLAELKQNIWRVGTTDGVVVVKRIQPAGKTEMTPGDFQRGKRILGRVMCE
jgi:methionyl-tRNA formyltransferase